MDKLTELVFELMEKDISILEMDDELAAIGIQYLSNDDAEHFYWYSDDIEYGEDEVGAYDIEDLPYNSDGSVNQSVYDDLVGVISKYISDHSN
jgi:hypothetical protein